MHHYSLLLIYTPLSTQTSTAPNSRAVISLWRRCFELQEKQEEATLEEIVRALEAEIFDGDSTNPPIRSSSAVAAREEFLADYYRSMMAQRQPPVLVAATPSTGTNISRPLGSLLTTMSPSLLVPRQDDSSDYIYLPQ
jgi:hypothetical protein